MATRKQVVVGLLMFLTVLIMLFFMTSDFSFSLSFRANSHPLKIKDEKERVHPKFFGGGGDVEVMVYKGKDGQIGGNMGIKDQQLALKWVQNNVAQFGGNKDKVREH